MDIASDRAARLAVVLLCALLLAAGIAAAGEDLVADELRIKAGFVLKFPAFVDWPAGTLPPAGGTFTIGVVGDDPLGAALVDVAKSARVHDLPVKIAQVWRRDDVQRFQMVYVAGSEEGRLDPLLEALDGKTVLTVGNFPRFVERGGMINLFVQGNRVRFAVNQHAAHRSGLLLNAQLLKLAATVIQD